MRLTKNKPDLVCTRQHCPWYHDWDLEKFFKWIFSSLGFLVVLFLVVWACLLLWVNTIGSKPKTTAQLKQEQAVEQMRITEL